MMNFLRLTVLTMLLALSSKGMAQDYKWDNLQAMSDLLRNLTSQPLAVASLTAEESNAALDQYRAYTDRLRLISNQVNEALLAKQNGDYNTAKEKLGSACVKLDSLRRDMNYDLKQTRLADSVRQQLQLLLDDVQIVMDGVGCSVDTNNGGSCSGSQWYSSFYNRCFEKYSSCSQYNYLDPLTCNSGKDNLQCDWSRSSRTCYAEGGNGGPGGGSNNHDQEWWSTIYNRWYPKNGSCEQYNGTNYLTCNNSKDNLQCQWNSRGDTCRSER